MLDLGDGGLGGCSVRKDLCLDSPPKRTDQLSYSKRCVDAGRHCGMFASGHGSDTAWISYSLRQRCQLRRCRKLKNAVAFDHLHLTGKV